MNSKRLAVLLLLLSLPLPVIAADALPKPFSLTRYQPMMDHSPFAVATAVTAPSAPSFAKDLYVANAARDKDGDFVTIASSTDKNFKKYLATNMPVDGYSIVSIEWSEKVGSTKVTIGKDGQTATLSFNEALLRGPVGPGGQAAQPVKDPQQPAPTDRSAAGQPPTAIVPGAQPNASKPLSPVAPGAQQNATKPMPVPMLPSPPPRVRGVIPRNPAGKNTNTIKPQPPQPEL